MRKITIKRKCDKCKGWGKKRLTSIHYTKGMIIDCPFCNGKGFIIEEAEIIKEIKDEKK